MKYPYLSRKAAAAKEKRDLAEANTPRREKMRAENQKKRRAAKKAGKNIQGKDYDHRTGSFESVHNNRGNFGKGTKKESPMDRDKNKKTISGKDAPKKRSFSEMAKKAKASGWKPTERPKKRTLKDMYEASKKSSNAPIKRVVSSHSGSIESAKSHLTGKSAVKRWSPIDRESNFAKLSKKIQGEGKSKSSADAIAYSIGAKKYGKAGMAAKAAAGRKK